MQLGNIDYAILAIYVFFVIGIGFALKRSMKSSSDFFLSGRSIPAWITGLAFISANLGALELVGMGASGAKYGIATCHFYWIGAIPAMVFLAVFMMPFYYGSKARSVPEYLKLRFDERTRCLNSITFAVMTVLASGISMHQLAKLLHNLLGWEYNISLWVCSGVVLIYVLKGGLTSAIYTEVLQFCMIVLGFAPVVYLGMRDVQGWSHLRAMLTNVAKEPASVNAAANAHPYVSNAWTSAWQPLLGGPTANPMGVDWFAMVFGLGFVLAFGYWCTNFLVVQRAMAARNMTAARRTPLIGAVPKMFLPALVILPGMLAIGLSSMPPKEVPQANMAATVESVETATKDAKQSAALIEYADGTAKKPGAAAQEALDAIGKAAGANFNDLVFARVVSDQAKAPMSTEILQGRINASVVNYRIPQKEINSAKMPAAIAATNMAAKNPDETASLAEFVSGIVAGTDKEVRRPGKAAKEALDAIHKAADADFNQFALAQVVVNQSNEPLSDADLGERLRKAAANDYDGVITSLLGRYCPSGLLGLALTALLASFMSGMAGNVTAFNTVWTYDLYQGLRRSLFDKPRQSTIVYESGKREEVLIVPKEPGDAHYMWMGRVVTVAGILLSIGAAYIAAQYNNAMDIIQLVFGFVNAPLFATFLLGMFSARTTSSGAFFGLLGGTGVSAAFHALTITAGNDPGVKGGYINVLHEFPSEMAQNFWLAIFAFSGCFLLTAIISLLGRREKSDEELKGLVYSLTPKTVDQNEAWFLRPGFIGTVLLIVCVVLNYIFW